MDALQPVGYEFEYYGCCAARNAFKQTKQAKYEESPNNQKLINIIQKHMH